MARLDLGPMRDVLGGKGQAVHGGGGDAAFVNKVEKYFTGTMMDARRLLEPLVEEAERDEESSDASAEE